VIDKGATIAMKAHRTLLAFGLIVAVSAGQVAHAQEAPLPDLSALSIEELGDIQVTSVSKRPQAIAQAPSAIYVITHDDIARSGALSIPEILRLAPNLQVAQASASRYVITARGLNGAPAAQNFSNKLLVLIDGRSVYSPLYSGVYWDVQGVLPQDIERIEVISGPGATLWGANAVNGVVNIITRKSDATQGGLVVVGAGDQDRTASLRYGGRINDDLTYRLYAQTFFTKDSSVPANDHWSRPQAGFRLDWSPSTADAVVLQGDAYQGFAARAGAPAEQISGHNLLARWNRSWQGGSTLQVQAYHDHVRRRIEADGSGFVVDTYDLDLQHGFSLGSRHDVIWGGGFRVSDYEIDGTGAISFNPASRRLTLSNLFIQDSISLSPTTKLILGMKAEDDPYVGPELLPNARLSWTPNEAITLWASASRAIRSPTPFDRDVVEFLDATKFLVGGPDFQTEKLMAYEIGARIQASPRAAVSVSTFYNVYDDLRSIEITPVTLLPLQWGNLMKGDTYGLEAWGEYQVAAWWRLSGAANYLDQEFKFKPGSFQVLGVSQAGNDPKYQASLKSSMNLGEDLTLDTALRYVSALPEPRVPAYVELNGRLGWNINDQVQLALSGRNLLHERHLEYTGGAPIPRSVYVDLQWRF
jgi:iron complex outermembrane receptor protein